MGPATCHNMPLLRDCKKMQWRWSVVLIMVLGASATFDDERPLTSCGRVGSMGGASAGALAAMAEHGLRRRASSSPGYREAEFKASKSTDKKVDWIKQTGCTDKEKVCTDGKLEVVGAGEILVAKAKALPSKDSAWATASCAATKSCRPERKAMMGNTSDTKPFWAASFVGNLQIATNTKGSAIRLGFIKMSMCKVRSSSNGCADSTELEDAAATQEFEEQQSTRRLLDSQSSGDSTCCTIKKMIHHCATRKDWSASFKECDVGGKVLAGMMV